MKINNYWPLCQMVLVISINLLNVSPQKFLRLAWPSVLTPSSAYGGLGFLIGAHQFYPTRFGQRSISKISLERLIK